MTIFFKIKIKITLLVWKLNMNRIKFCHMNSIKGIAAKGCNKFFHVGMTIFDCSITELLHNLWIFLN